MPAAAAAAAAARRRVMYFVSSDTPEEVTELVRVRHLCAHVCACVQACARLRACSLRARILSCASANTRMGVLA